MEFGSARKLVRDLFVSAAIPYGYLRQRWKVPFAKFGQ